MGVCYCTKCGKQQPEDALYCSGCGAKLERNSVDESVNKQLEQTKETNTHKWAMLCTIVGVALVILIVMMVCLGNTKKESQDDETKKLELQLYDVTVDEIDVYAENRQPNARDYSLEWDSTLFYFLEDVGPEETDGQIEYFDVTRRQLRNAVSGNMMEYEIYKNPATGKIHKIVSIEQMDNSLEIIDYYYLDTGAVNFIYKRNDSVYTPTYATIDKTGERYYFNNDTLVKWRWIDVPRQVEQVVLQYDEANESYTQHLYNEISDGGKETFDAIEKQMLNAAYNTYDAISKSADYGNIKGYVLDENGEPLADAEIEVYVGTSTLGVLSTDEKGYYETGISFYEEGYQLEVSANGYKTSNIYEIVVEADSITTWVDTVYLTSNDEAEYSVELVVYDGDTLSIDEDGKVIKENVPDAEVVIRRGLNNVDGEEVTAGSCDEDGKLIIELENGVYTVEVTRKGYAMVRQNIVVTDEKTIEIPLVAELDENQLKIVLTWEGEYDLDSCLFTPDKSFDGDMAYINSVNMLDESGNQLNCDIKDGKGAEVIYVADTSKGTYKYYVSDYANCLDGNLSATDMLNMNIQVTVYDKNGFVISYTMPRNLSGVVWEVFEVKNGNVIALHHSYTNLEGKDWWLTDKNMLDIEVCADLKQVLENMASWDWHVKGDLENVVEELKKKPKEVFDFIEYSINNGRELNCVPYNEVPHSGDLACMVGETSVELLNTIYNSLTGETYDYSTEVGKDSENGAYCWNDGYLLYMGADGDGWCDSLKNYSVVRNQNGLWEITAEYWGWNENVDVCEQKLMDITFTLIKNPSSIFNGYSILDIETQKTSLEQAFEAKRAYYNVLVNGDIPDCGDVTWEGIKQDSLDELDGGWDFVLKDINGDGIEELLIGEPYGCLVDWAVEKIWYILGYEDGRVKVMDYNLEANSERGIFILNNGELVRMNWSSYILVPQDSKYYDAVMAGEEEPSGSTIFIYADCAGTQMLIEYQVSYVGGDTEYFINDKLVSEEEWYASMQGNIIEQLIPQSEYWDLNKENLDKVLLEQ